MAKKTRGEEAPHSKPQDADVVKQAVSLAIKTHGEKSGEAVVEQALRLLGMREEDIKASRKRGYKRTQGGGGRIGGGSFFLRVQARLAKRGVAVSKRRAKAVLLAAECLRREEEVRGKLF